MEQRDLYSYLTSFCLMLMSLPVKSADPEVITISGKIRGFNQRVNGVDIQTFLGVPFAKPPVNDQRFRRPTPAEMWTKTLETKKFASVCYQPILTVFKGRTEEQGEEMWNPKTNMSEDCLYLNIWAPHTSPDTKLATMVWIYGGGFFSGSTGLDVYDGKYLASLNDVIVVSIAYRVGPLGFLYLEHSLSPGNMGLLDQTLGLNWVYDNIESFGGSRKLITIFGESAGAASVNYHLVSPLSVNFFQRAILQSGSVLGHWAFSSRDVAKKKASALVSDFNCNKKTIIDTINCLKLVNAAEFMYIGFVPTVDNYFIKQSPNLYLSEDSFTKKELLAGVNHDEYNYFLVYEIFDEQSHPNYDFDRSDFIEHIPNVIPNFSLNATKNILMRAILQEYELPPYPNKGTYLDVLDDIGGDYWFKCPVITLAQNFNKVKTGAQSIYMYSFEHRSSSSAWPDWMGVLHGDEIEYVFGLPTKLDSTYTTEEADLSRYMMKYWTNFAKTGDPNDKLLPIWPEYTKGNEEYMILKAGKRLNTSYGLRHQQCAFWNDYIPKLRTALNADGKDTGMCINGDNKVSSTSTLIIAVFVLTLAIPVNIC